MARSGPGRSGPCRGRPQRAMLSSTVDLRSDAGPRGSDHEVSRAISGPDRCGPTAAALGTPARDELVELRVARLEVRARVVDDAGERGDCRNVWRPDEDRCVGRAHPPTVVAVRGR